MDELSPLEQARKERNARIPKPNVPVQCKHCGSLNKKAKQTKSALDFYWRYFHCKDCGKNYWCGVRYGDKLTVFTINTPQPTRINSTDMMTGNLRNILPAGHPAVTADYDQFLPNGKLPRDVLLARLDAEQSAANPAELQSEVTIAPAAVPDPAVTTTEDIDWETWVEFDKWLKDQGHTEVAQDIKLQLYPVWLRANYPEPK